MLKVVSPGNGRVAGTRLYDTTTGNEVNIGATAIRIDMDSPGATVTASVDVRLDSVEVTAGKAEWLVRNPVTGEREAVRTIAFMSGQIVDLDGDGTPRLRYPTTI